jgi:signal peptidase I
MALKQHPQDSTQSKAQDNPSKKSVWRSQSENIQILAIALGLALFIRFFIAEPRYIPSDSMVPTLWTGDRLVIEKVSYRLHPPESGDIVVFRPPQPLQELGFGQDEALIKRIVGRPGQTIAVEHGLVYVDGQPLPEDYIAEPPNYEMEPVQIPEDTFFVLGDNRNNSNDSHVWGPLLQQNIIGQAVFRFWPPDRFGAIAN